MFLAFLFRVSLVLWSNSPCLNVLGDSNPLLLRFMCVRDIFMAECVVKKFTFHSYKSKKSIILIFDMKIIHILFV